MLTSKVFGFFRATLCMVVLLGYPTGACADHVLLKNGLGLFNVTVYDTNSTASRPLRIMFRESSFGYDFRTNSVSVLTSRSNSHWVEDYETTSIEVDKFGARKLMERRKWHAYFPAPDPVIILPTPEPVIIVTPVPTPVPLPIEVVPATVPISDRIFQQLDWFVKDQHRLALDIQSSITRGKMSEDQGKQLRLRWVQEQRQVLEKYFPSTEQRVRDAMEEWDSQIDKVRKTGKFSTESF